MVAMERNGEKERERKKHIFSIWLKSTHFHIYTIRFVILANMYESKSNRSENIALDRREKNVARSKKADGGGAVRNCRNGVQNIDDTYIYTHLYICIYYVWS